MKQIKHNITKNWRVLRELFYLRFHGLAVFRLDFFAPFFVDGSLFLIQLLAFGVVYSNVETIGSWGRGEMILYIGTFSLLNAVNMTIYFFGVIRIPHKIRSGEAGQSAVPADIREHQSRFHSADPDERLYHCIWCI